MTNEQYQELVARLDDHDENLKHIMQQFGPASWTSIKRQRDENMKAQGTRIPSHPTARFGQK